MRGKYTINLNKQEVLTKYYSEKSIGFLDLCRYFNISEYLMNQFFKNNGIIKKPRGDILSTRKRTDEQKLKYRLCKLGDKNPMKKLTGDKHPNKNKIWTIEEKEKMSNSALKKWEREDNHTNYISPINGESISLRQYNKEMQILTHNTQEYKKLASDRATKYFSVEENYKKVSEIFKKKHLNDLEYHNTTIANLYKGTVVFQNKMNNDIEFKNLFKKKVSEAIKKKVDFNFRDRCSKNTTLQIRFKNDGFKKFRAFSQKQNVIILCRSLLEIDYINVLDQDDDITEYTYEPFGIFYITKDGNPKRYIPDFLVTSKTKGKQIVEIKRKEEFHTGNNMNLKLISKEQINNFCRQYNYRFNVYMEKEIAKCEVLKKALLPME